jgi:KTSC domain
MERIEIPAPSFMAAHRYDELSKSLAIEFRDGRVWIHSNVPPDVYEQLRTSDFPMLTWAVNIRQALAENGHEKRYPVVKIHAR